jgi:hypothetical protein
MPTTTASRAGGLPADRTLRTGCLVLGVGYAALALFQAVDPAGFVSDVGPFGAPNGHYVRDLSTFTAAVAVGLVLAAGRPSWRVPVLAIAVIQSALHLVNHVADAGDADPVAMGVANAIAIAVLLAAEAWLLAVARRAEADR